MHSFDLTYFLVCFIQGSLTVKKRKIRQPSNVQCWKLWLQRKKLQCKKDGRQFTGSLRSCERSWRYLIPIKKLKGPAK